MRYLTGALLSLAVVGMSATVGFAQVRAFPTAEGFGALATGGRGGSIYHVTSLNDSGAGSFRDAVSVSNRIVVFDVGGYINLLSECAVQSNITIAGQTAPGGGIGFTGAEVSMGQKSNVIVRHVRFRPGDTATSTANGVNMYRGQNIVLDHVSVEFAPWNNLSAVGDGTRDATNITVQNSIIANPINQQFGAHMESLGDSMTMSNNLWVNGHNRQPMAKINMQYKNNVVYNYQAGYTTANTSGVFSHDIVNNYFITGPATTSPGNAFYQINANQSYYSVGNLRDSNNDGVLNGSGTNPSGGTTLAAPWAPSTLELPTLSAAEAFNYVLTYVGATPLNRDEVDSLVVAQTQTLGSGPSGTGAGTAGPIGSLYTHQFQTGLSNGGFGTLAGGAKPTDTDNDAIPDSWESTHGLNPNNAADALALNPLGYRMVEQYVNELGTANPQRTWSAPSGNWSTAANWTGGVVPGPFDDLKVVGAGGVEGNISVTSGVRSAMSLAIGGGGSASGEAVTVSGGKLDVYDTTYVGTENNAELNISAGDVESYNIQLGNTVYTPSAVNYTGTINMSGGTLRAAQIVRGAGSPGAWNSGGQWNWSGGTLQAMGQLKVNVPITLSGAGGTVDTAGFTGDISGSISGDGGLSKSGAGTLTVSGLNSYGGPTSVNGGSLKLNSSSALGSSSLIVVAPGASIDATALGGLNLTGAKTLSGGGQILGNLNVGTGSTVRPQGTFSVQANMVGVQAEAMTLGSDWAVFNAATHGSGNGGSYGGAGLSGGGIVLVSGESLATPSASGAATISVNVPVAGSWKLFARIVEPSQSGVAGDPSTAAGGNNSLWTSNSAGTLSATPANFKEVQTATTLPDASHWALVSPSLTALSGVVGPPIVAGIDYSLAAGPQTLTIYGREVGTILDGFVLTTANLTSTQLDSALAGTTVLGSTSTMSVSGAFTQAAGSTLQIDVGAGNFLNSLAVTGAASLAGNLAVNLTGGFTPQTSDVFTILTSTNLSGTFDGIANASRLAVSSGGGSFLVSYDYALDRVTLSNYLAAALLGDYNNDGSVDAADFVVWRKNFGTTNVLPNDPFGGSIGTAQYDTWRSHFGETSGAGATNAISGDSSTGAAVPEPATLILMNVAAIWAVLSRRRGRPCLSDTFGRTMPICACGAGER